jgi:hypothetical protein
MNQALRRKSVFSTHEKLCQIRKMRLGVKMQNEMLEKAMASFANENQVRYHLMEALMANFHVTLLYRIPRVSHNGFYSPKTVQMCKTTTNSEQACKESLRVQICAA